MKKKKIFGCLALLTGLGAILYLLKLVKDFAFWLAPLFFVVILFFLTIKLLRMAGVIEKEENLIKAFKRLINYLNT